MQYWLTWVLASSLPWLPANFSPALRNYFLWANEVNLESEIREAGEPYSVPSFFAQPEVDSIWWHFFVDNTQLYVIEIFLNSFILENEYYLYNVYALKITTMSWQGKQWRNDFIVLWRYAQGIKAIVTMLFQN